MPTLLSELLSELPEPDVVSSDAVAQRAAQVLRPTGAFERLDRVAAWLGRWQRTSTPRVERPTVVVFGADHGVAASGVSAYPAEVTAAMKAAIEAEAASVCAMGKAVGAEVLLTDVGIGDPTGDITVADAMTPSEFDTAVAAGVDAVERIASEHDADLLVIGELGIGNTTVAAAVAAALDTDGSAERWVGPGTGVSGEALERKINAVAKAVERVGSVTTLEALRRLGGKELAAMAGAAVAARKKSLPVVVDGFVVTAALATLEAAQPGALDHCIAGHCSGEPGHALLLERLGWQPLVELGLRLGEGTGALAAVPLVKIAAACVTDVATFSEFGLT